MNVLDLPTEETPREAGQALRALSAFRARRPAHVEVVAEGDGPASVTVQRIDDARRREAADLLAAEAQEVDLGS